MKKLFKKGFTLVELLVVIAILAILAGVSVVGYLSFTQKARESRAQSELVQIRDYLTASLIDTSETDGVYIDQAAGYISVTFEDAAAEDAETEAAGAHTKAEVVEAIATAADTAEDLPIFNADSVELYDTNGAKLTYAGDSSTYQIYYVSYTVDGGSAYWTVKDGSVVTVTLAEGATSLPIA